MATRVSSPRLVGRQVELERLLAAFKAAKGEERASTYLIGGEAGVGKSRVVAELATRVQEAGGLVAVGACVELVDRALPFGPVVQALRDLHRRLEPELLVAVVGDAEPAWTRLLPELGDGGGGTGDGGAALFEHLLGTLVRLGDQLPTLLVLEDLHWADHSTRDLLTFLARNLRDARVLLLGTFRSDDLHRKHPLRPVLAELERSGSVTRLDLPRFNRDEIAELVTAIRGEPAGATLVDRLFERTDGNAFFIEELLAAEEICDDTLPETLRDIVLARIDTLSESAQRVLRVMSAVGRSADHRLLAAVADVPDTELNAGLRDALAHQVLVADSDRLEYHFRHALVHETVYEDLLPSERVRLHSAVAEILEAQPAWFEGDATELASELACHWNAARDQRRELPAALAAADAATQKYAYPEALAHIERAVSVWDHVPDAPELAHMSRVQLLRSAADAAQMSGRFDRAVAYIREALESVDPVTEPVEAGLARERLGRYLWQVNQPAGEYLAEVREAVRLVPAEPPTVERARVLATLGQQLMLAGRNAEAIETCTRAIEVALQIGARVEEGHARNSLGSALSGVCRYVDGEVELERARDIALETNSWSDLARAAANSSANLQASGRWEEALALALEGAEVARRHGLERACGTFLRFNAAESLFELGRWDEMEEQLREADVIDAEGIDRQRSFLTKADLLAGRGDYEAAGEQLTASRAMRGDNDDPNPALEHAVCEARIRGWSGDADGAISLARAETRSDAVMSGCSDAGPQLLTIAASLTDDLELIAAFVKALDNWVGSGRWGGAGAPDEVPRLRAQLDAELHRDDPMAWRAVADAWERDGRLPKAGYARYRESGAHLAVGAHNAAESALRAADVIASRVGFAWISEQISTLARDARLDLGEAVIPASPAERIGLTVREREVLRLVSEGRTNRQIGEALFIATKTVSVHVSNVLAKLQVANRGEAAAAARRLGLDGDTNAPAVSPDRM